MTISKMLVLSSEPAGAYGEPPRVTRALKSIQTELLELVRREGPGRVRWGNAGPRKGPCWYWVETGKYLTWEEVRRLSAGRRNGQKAPQSFVFWAKAQ